MMLKLKMLARETDLPTTIIRQFLLGLEPKPWNWVRPPLQEPQLRLLDGELVEPEVQKVPRAFNDKLGCARKLSGCYFLLPATSHYPKVCLPPVFAYFLEMSLPRSTCSIDSLVKQALGWTFEAFLFHPVLWSSQSHWQCNIFPVTLKSWRVNLIFRPQVPNLRCSAKTFIDVP